MGSKLGRWLLQTYAALSGDPFQFLLVNCHALETIIASHTVPIEMNPVVVVGFHPDGGWNYICTERTDFSLEACLSVKLRP